MQKRIIEAQSHHHRSSFALAAAVDNNKGTRVEEEEVSRRRRRWSIRLGKQSSLLLSFSLSSFPFLSHHHCCSCHPVGVSGTAAGDDTDHDYDAAADAGL